MELVAACYTEYKAKVIPVIENPAYVALSAAPTISMIDSRLAEIDELYGKARDAKPLRFPNPRWYEGLDAITDAHKSATEIHNELTKYLNLYLQIEREIQQQRVSEQHQIELVQLRSRLAEMDSSSRRLTIRWTIISIAATIVSTGLGILIGTLLTRGG